MTGWKIALLRSQVKGKKPFSQRGFIGTNRTAHENESHDYSTSGFLSYLTG
jgi:hypothetical protein